MPRGATGYFDATVEEGEWDQLRALVECPQIFRMEEMADDLPADFVEQMDRPADELDAQSLPLPVDVRQHLGTCPACREAFNRSLMARLRLRRAMLCPPVKMLARYIRGESIPIVEAHLEWCRACGAEVHVLRQVAAPAWLRVVLRKLAQLPQDIDERVMNLRTMLTMAFKPAGLTPAHATRGQAGNSQRETGKWLSSHLRDPQSGRGLSLAWDSESDAFRIGDIRSSEGEPVERFRIEFLLGDESLWAGASEETQIVIPRTELERAVHEGAELVIRVIRTSEG